MYNNQIYKVYYVNSVQPINRNVVVIHTYYMNIMSISDTSLLLVSNNNIALLFI
jgi:hypothetical protein